ncbi:GNAT family N-acetyltransferase [Pseudomonas sp. NPDC089569]|uniref:GNAT family N-acetyltransferase n=1 Tax=Pseudomonas sp. NPDC089569 TaxID=3390722 RepID=UPI003CFF109F
MTNIAIYKNSIPGHVQEQIVDLVRANMTDLSMHAIPQSNFMFAVYQYAIACEVQMYLDVIAYTQKLPAEIAIAHAEDNPAKVIGFVLYLPLQSHPEACGVTYMAVAGEYRRKGIAKAMMAEVIKRYPHVELTCSPAKVPYYESMGFQMLRVRDTQIVMNTRDHTSQGLMQILDVAPIYQSSEVKEVHSALVQRYGLRAMVDAEKQLERHLKQLSYKASVFFRERAAVTHSTTAG